MLPLRPACLSLAAPVRRTYRGQLDPREDPKCCASCATAGRNGEAFGIVTSGNLGGEVSRNRVSGISPDGGANKRGIWANGGRPAIRNNSLINHVPNVSGDSGIVCNNSAPVARDNIVIGFGTPGASVRNCISSGNTVNL